MYSISVFNHWVYIIYPQVSGLETLLTNGAESEPGQTACFALSCLASKDDGHALLMESPSLPRLLDGLVSLLKSRDPDNTWFAAMWVPLEYLIHLVCVPQYLILCCEVDLVLQVISTLLFWLFTVAFSQDGESVCVSTKWSNSS